jgi:MOSC domain-containing protein YiiM
MRDGRSEHPVVIELLLASPHSRYEGRPGDGPRPATVDETPDRIEVRAGLGVVGDRYFAKPAHVHASVTVMAMESLEAVYSDLRLAGPVDAAATRRNILLRGVPADELRGVRFSLDSGDGPVLFQGNRPAAPCAWMDVVIAPGAFRAMRGRGGIRCEPLSSGTLRLGPAVLTIEPVD